MNARLFGIQNVVVFSEPFKGHKLSKKKVQWLNLAPWLWPALIGLPFKTTVGMHYETIAKFFKPCLNLSSPHYFWFIQYMKNNNGDCKKL
jgi:hypothetical protein